MINEITVTLTISVDRLAELQKFCQGAAQEPATVTSETPKAKPKAKPKVKAKTKPKVDPEAQAEREAIQAEAESPDAVLDRKALEADLRAWLPQIGTEALREAKTKAGIEVRLQAAEGDDLVAYRKLADDLLAGLEGQL